MWDISSVEICDVFQRENSVMVVMIVLMVQMKWIVPL
jgi:hypothetical protein